MAVSSKLKAENIIWSTEKVNQYLKAKMGNAEQTLPSPFFDGDKDVFLRKGNLEFDQTDDEYDEMCKCATDIVYFAETYCQTMTDDGIMIVELYPYQKRILRDLKENRYNIWLAARQSGKTTTAAFFMMWYSMFHVERNALIVANRAETMQEIIDKCEIIYRELPFFLKAGILVNNKRRMEFDNGCRIIGQATTPKPALGFTIHLLYADEFAHIPKNIIDPFYRSMYPTLSSSEISRILITSTANGLNKFEKLYKDAVRGWNTYHAIRVDWWEVPGRDDAWKEREIRNFGQEYFNQEYDNQFLSNSKILLNGPVLNFWRRIEKPFEWREWDEFENYNIDYDEFIWDPNFIDYDLEDDFRKFVISIDVSESIELDYNVVNVFEIEPLSLAKIRTLDKYKDETDFFRLKQVGLYRSNKIPIPELAKLISVLMFKILGVENIITIIEMNRAEGQQIHEILKTAGDYDDNLMLQTLHTVNSINKKVGVKLTKVSKPLFCKTFKNMAATGKIILQEPGSVLEAVEFGQSGGGIFEGQGDNDDIVITAVNCSPLFDSEEYTEMVGGMYDELPSAHSTAIDERLDQVPDNMFVSDDIDYSVVGEYS